MYNSVAETLAQTRLAPAPRRPAVVTPTAANVAPPATEGGGVHHHRAAVRSVMAPPAGIAFRLDWWDFPRGRRRHRHDRRLTGTDKPGRAHQAAGSAPQGRPFIAQESDQPILKLIGRLGAC